MIATKKEVIEQYIVNEKGRDGVVERFRMHLHQQNGCIDSDTLKKFGINCRGGNKARRHELAHTVNPSHC